MGVAVRPLAFYLPQFYPNPDNDSWWEKGFTEWTLVSRAKPLFKGHYQPHLPSETGFYDLRIHENLVAQAKLAKEYGLYGFMFYHYWFHGKRFLELPVNKLLASKEPDFPFCLCWANETWTRVWDGRPGEILQKQEYSEADDLNHISWLCTEVFQDPRYIKVHGKPLFGIWDINDLPDPAKTFGMWQDIAIKSGFPGLYLLGVENLSRAADPGLHKLDAVVEFTPDWGNLPRARKRNILDIFLNLSGIYRSPYYDHKIMEYSDLVNNALNFKKPSYRYFPGLTPSWDNTPRRMKRNAHVFHNASPELFAYWLRQTIENFKPASAEENFIFINAWNEWAEGAHLEPDYKHGRTFLEAMKKELQNAG